MLKNGVIGQKMERNPALILYCGNICIGVYVKSLCATNQNPAVMQMLS